MSRNPIINIGEIFEIPLSNGRIAYGQYVDENSGPIIRIFDYFSDGGSVDLEDIYSSKLLFPPIHVGLKDPIKSGMWKIIGKLPIKNYTYTGYLSWHPVTPINPKEGAKVKRWFLWDGTKSIDLGSSLPDEYKGYESNGVFSADMVVERIETGFDMYDFPKKYNRFLTKEEIKNKYPAVNLD